MNQHAMKHPFTDEELTQLFEVARNAVTFENRSCTKYPFVTGTPIA